MTKKPRVLAIATHPIQYQIPWFQALARAEDIDFSVLFIQLPDAQQQGVGFGVPFQWDIPMLEGYRWQQAPELRGRGGLRGFFASRIHRPSHLLRDLAPDVVLVTGWHAWPLLQMLLAARLRGIPVIMRGESNALRQRPLRVRMLHRILLGLCSAFLTIGKANRDFYRGYGIAEERLFDAFYFVDNARFIESAARLAPRHDELRASWHIPPGAVCFCYVGKLEPKKRILDLLEALHIVSGQSRQLIHLLVVGAGDLMPLAQAYAEAHDLPVSFAGFLNQTEMPSAYAVADCLVMLSDYGETWGLVVNEAMACGVAAIVSNRVGCGPDLVEHGVTGMVFPFGDVQALADILRSLAENPQVLREMGDRAHVRIDAYSTKRAVAGTVEAIQWVLRDSN